jgi:hypothetical protein
VTGADGPRGSSSTAQGLSGQDRARQRRRLRLLGIGALFAVVLAGAVGLLGPREDTVTRVEGGWSLSMEYGSVVRSGQPVPMEIEVTHPGGFTGPVRLIFDQTVFDRFDFQNWYPNPDSETAGPETVVYDFVPPDGDRWHVSLNARVAPWQLGGRFTYWLGLVVGDRVVARTEYVVWVVP